LKYRVLITNTCLTLIQKTLDRKIHVKILDRTGGLSDDPHMQGKELVKTFLDFARFMSWEDTGSYPKVTEAQ